MAVTNPRRTLKAHCYVCNAMPSSVSGNAALMQMFQDIASMIDDWKGEIVTRNIDCGAPSVKIVKFDSSTWDVRDLPTVTRIPQNMAFSGVPVGNKFADPSPFTVSPAPAWTNSNLGFTFNGVKNVTSSSAAQDTSWTITSVANMCTIDIDDQQLGLIRVVETSNFNSLNNASGRKITVNSDLWALASTNERKNWVWSAMFLAQNTGYIPGTNGCLRAGHYPGNVAQSDWDALEATWDIVESLFSYPAGSIPSLYSGQNVSAWVPVPGY